MTELCTPALRNHEWLKHPAQATFHAYPDIREGTLPICGELYGINKSSMEISGEHSSTCLICFFKLYGFSWGK